jgi:hypothetical protein
VNPFPPVKDTRMVAGAPTTGDVIWCAKKPLSRSDYPPSLTDEQWSRLQTAFPNGVCDFSQPNRHAVPFGETWREYD